MSDSESHNQDAEMPIEGPAHRTSRDPAEGPRDDVTESEENTREYTETVDGIQEGPDQRQTRDPAEGARDESDDEQNRSE